MIKKIFLLILLSVFITFTLYSQERGNKDEAVKLINDFTDYFNKYGAEKAYNEINKNSKFKIKDLYLFVVHQKSDTETSMVAHGAYEALVGKDIYNMQDADGKNFMKDFKRVFLTKEGEGWVDYKWPHPSTGKVERKTTFIKRINEQIYVGCGVSL